MQVTVDRAGRLVIPKPIRDEAGIAPGMKVEIRVIDGKIELEPVREWPKLVRRGRLLVAVAAPGTPPMTREQSEQQVDDDREARYRMIVGDLPS